MGVTRVGKGVKIMVLVDARGGEVHRFLTSYFAYYRESRTHLSLDRNAPVKRDVEPPGRGKIIAIPQAGDLHHRYTRAA